MSFQDLERGLGERAPLAQDTSIDPESDLEFRNLARGVSIQIHKINANVSAITKLVDLLGSNKDSSDLRTKLHNLTDVTRDILKDTQPDLKKFAQFSLSPDDRQHLREQQKVGSDFAKALQSFQAASRRSAERQRTFVEKAKTQLDPALESPALSRSQDGEQLVELAEQRQLQVEGIPDSELEFQEQLIAEREGEIEQIEQGISELNQIFKDLGQIVTEQGSMIDNIEQNVFHVTQDTRNASEQLVEAHASQRRAGRRAACLFLILLVVLSIVLIAVLS